MVSGETGHDLWFSSAPYSSISLTPGMNEVALYTHDSAPGIYTAEYAELLLHQVNFSYKLLEYNQKMTMRVNPHPLLPNVTVDWNPTQVQGYSAGGPVFTARLVTTGVSCREGSRLEVVPAEHVSKASLHRAHRGYYTSPTDSPALTRTNSLVSLLSTEDFSRRSTPDATPKLTPTASLWSEPADIMCQYFLRSVGRFAAVSGESHSSSVRDSPGDSTVPPARDATTRDGKDSSASCSPSGTASPVDQIRARRILPDSDGEPVILWLNLYANGQIQLPELQPREVLEVDFQADRRFIDLYEHTVTWATLAQYYVSYARTPEDAEIPLTTPSQSKVIQPISSSMLSFQRGLHTLSTRVPLSLGFSLQRQRQGGYLRVMVTSSDTIPVIIDGVELADHSQVTPDENKSDAKTTTNPSKTASGGHIVRFGYTIDSGAINLYRHYHQILLAGDCTVFTFKLTFNSPDAESQSTATAASNNPQYEMRSGRDLLQCIVHYRPLHEVMTHLANPYLDQALATAHHTPYTGLLRELLAKLLFHYADLNCYCLEGKLVLQTESGILPSSASTSTETSPSHELKSLSHMGSLSQLPTAKAALAYELPDTQSALLAIVVGAVQHLEDFVGTVLAAKHEHSTDGQGGAVPSEVLACRTLKATYRLAVTRCLSTVSLALTKTQCVNEETSASNVKSNIPMLESTKEFSSFPLYPGQLLPITVTFTHQWDSAAWLMLEDLECGFQLRTSAEDWLVVGPQEGPLAVPRGDKSLRSPETAEGAYSVGPASQTLELGLIPLRAGRLALPRFVVHMASPRGLDVMPTTYHDYPCTHLEVLPAPGIFHLQLDYCSSVPSTSVVPTPNTRSKSSKPEISIEKRTTTGEAAQRATLNLHDNAAVAPSRPTHLVDQLEALVSKQYVNFSELWSCYEVVRGSGLLKELTPNHFVRLVLAIINNPDDQFQSAREYGRNGRRPASSSISSSNMRTRVLSSQQLEALEQVIQDWHRHYDPLMFLNENPDESQLTGVERDNYITYARVIGDAYAQLGRTTDVLNMIDQFDRHGVVPPVRLCNSLLEHLVKTQDSTPMLTLVEKILVYGIIPTPFTLKSSLMLLADAGLMKAAENLLDYWRSLGREVEPNMYIRILTGYAKAGKTTEASAVLSSVLERAGDLSPLNVNRVLKALSMLGEVSKMFDLYHSLKANHGFVPNAFTVHPLLQQAVKIRDHKAIRELSEDLDKYRIELDDYLLGTMLSAYVELGDTGKVLMLGERIMQDPQVHNIAVYNTLLQSYAHLNQPDRAMELFDVIQRRGINLNRYSYTMAIQLAKRQSNRWLKELMNQVRSRDFQWDLALYATMVKGHLHLKEVDEAYQLFDQMIEQGLRPDIYLFVHLIGGLCNNRQFTEALAVKASMSTYHVQPTLSIFRHLIRGAVSVGNFDALRQILAEFRSSGYRLDGTIYASIISGFLSTGAVNLAKATVDECLATRVHFTLNLYTASITALGRAQEFDKMLELLDQMIQAGYLMPVPLASAVLGCCKTPDSVNVVCKLHDLLRSEKIDQPDRLLFNLFIRAYRNVDKPHQALAMWDTMISQNRKPDNTTLIFLFETCAKFGLVQPVYEIVEKAQAVGVTLNAPGTACLIKTWCTLRDGKNATLLMRTATQAKQLKPSRKMLTAIYLVNLIQGLKVEQEQLERWLSSYYPQLFPEMDRFHQLPKRKLELLLQDIMDNNSYQSFFEDSFTRT
ncbi:hypothetical protein IWQ62_003012 [Dispira parvispora]|uniref:TRAPPC10/Trs130 C-terminal domain-containing protein n=1 Tax=Dispira parvispora TaxID=1520584 RepID=A0A9W8AUY9_9FUNG|nr:hypothetical protein IWQ62_003012 [Dispira parvispora]